LPLLEDGTAVSVPRSLLLNGAAILELELDRSSPEGVNRVNMPLDSRLLMLMQDRMIMVSGNQQRYIRH